MKSQIKNKAGWWNEKVHVLEESKRFSSRNEFCKKSSTAYHSALKNGWINEMPWLISKLHFFTKEEIFEISKQYSTKTSFLKGSPKAYQKAQREGWLKELTWLSKEKKQYSKNEVLIEAKKYKSRIEFKKYNSLLYRLAIKNKWINEMTWFINPSIKWTKENVLIEARKYQNRKDFREKASGAYHSALSNKWIDLITWFTSPKGYEQNCYCVYAYIDKEKKTVYIGLTNNQSRRRQEHLKGKTINDRIIYSSVYNYFIPLYNSIPEPLYLELDLTSTEAREKEDYWCKYYLKKNWTLLNKAKTGKYSGSLGSAATKWTKTKTFSEAKKYSSRLEFAQKGGSAYNVARKKNWLDEMYWFETFDRTVPRKWDKKTVFEESKRFKSRGDFSIKSAVAYKVALDNNWLDEMYWLSCRTSWTKENVFEESKKYSLKKDFERGNRSAYHVACTNNWINDMPWLKKYKHKPSKWTKEVVFEESKKYKGRKDFYKGCHSAYQMARIKKWLDEISDANGWVYRNKK